MNTKQAILIPQWISAALVKARLPLTSVTDYKTMKEAFPALQLAAFLALQKWNALTIVLEDSPFALYSAWVKAANEQQETELASVLLPMSDSQLVKDYLYEQLVDESTSAENADVIQVQDLDESHLAIVVSKGVVDNLRYDYNAVAVIRKVVSLKLAYQQNNAVLDASSWLRRYLRLIAVTCANKPPAPFLS